MNPETAEYDNEALSYDKTRFHGRFGNYLDCMHKKLVNSLLYSRLGLVLDAGTGTGRFAIWLAEKGYRVIAIDISKLMLEEAKRKTRTIHADVGLVQADLHSLPYKKGVFDACICINVIDHISDISRFFGEVGYALKPEGFLVFNFSNLQSPYLPIAIVINLTEHALFSRGRIHSRWSTIKEISVMLSEADFDIKEIRGCIIASPIPLKDRLVWIVKSINLLFETSRCKFFCGSLFVCAHKTSVRLKSDKIKSHSHAMCDVER